MPTYATPGVYVEEIPAGRRPIEAVGTSTAAFLGEAPDRRAPKHVPLAFNNWTEFVNKMVGESTKSTPLTQAVYGFFENGGSRCYVVNVGADGSLVGDGKKREGLGALETVDDVSIVAAPGYLDPASQSDLLSHCETMKDRFAILDGPAEVEDISSLVKVATASADSKKAAATAFRPRNSDSGFGAFYYPWINVRDPLEPTQIVQAPPSGHLAGVYARTDATRGVHKAPANEALRGALGVTHVLAPQEQAELNPNGVNCIRFFSGEGVRVWGARTLAPSSSEWRYLNVRRLFNMVEQSIARNTRWIVFEPNDQSLWKSIRRDVTSFLTLVWRSGALMGSTPQEAFFVKCDEETNTQDTIDAGQVVTLIGLAPVKPAEFIIFRIGQHTDGTDIES